MRAAHAGDSLGFSVAAKPVEITGIAIVRVRDEKIVAAWNNFDFTSMFRQLGTP